MASAHFLSLTPAGLYCPAGDFFVDPVRPVPRAIVTHGHSDHARAGHGAVLATRETLAIMALRLGPEFAGSTQALPYGETLRVGAIDVSLHPAGHVLGSAQIRMSDSRAVVVASGDYKREEDPTCAPFEPVACDLFITEATFGLPVFRHPPAGDEIARLLDSLRLFPERAHLVGAYALGKAQRLIALLRRAGYERPIYLHGAMEKLCAFYAAQGVELGALEPVAGRSRGDMGGEIVLCPPGALQDLWSRKFPDPVAVFASGWMRVRARARQRGVELPLVVSDHADWSDLTRTILETGCDKTLVTHGEAEALVHWARGAGLEAEPLHLLGYGDEEAETAEAEASS
ncbi:ligase-associated DNA damage response exonuclease [Methylocella sp.]|uniref:ligase-associated DNA damage response exonuclease n=1 Tax=Methylocella sp. TaxID=1978226 RepID=UPI0037846618